MKIGSPSWARATTQSLRMATRILEMDEAAMRDRLRVDPATWNKSAEDLADAERQLGDLLAVITAAARRIEASKP